VHYIKDLFTSKASLPNGGSAELAAATMTLDTRQIKLEYCSYPVQELMFCI
jgi:hypothetical protein